AYAMYLIEHSFGIPANNLTNHIFNQSILKRRINMLNKKRTPRRASLRLVLLIPLCGAMIAISTMAFTKNTAFIDVYPEKYTAMHQVAPPPPKKQGTSAKKVFNIAYKIDPVTKKRVVTEKRLIIINEKLFFKFNDSLTGFSNIDRI